MQQEHSTITMRHMEQLQKKAWVRLLYAGTDPLGWLVLPRLAAPPWPKSLRQLKLNTHIQVYRDHWLGENQSQLTLPRYHYNLTPSWAPGRPALGAGGAQ